MTIETRDDIRRICWLWAWSGFGSDGLSIFGIYKSYRMHFCPSCVLLLYLRN